MSARHARTDRRASLKLGRQSLAAVAAAATGAVALFSARAHAAALTWDTVSNGGGVIDAGSGTWDTNPGNLVWNDGTNNVAWTNTTSTDAVFGGPAGSYTVSVTNAGVTARTLTFSTNGYTLTGANGGTSSVTLGSSQTITVASGVTANLSSTVNLITSGNPVFSGGGTFNVSGTVSFGGNLQVNNPTTLDVLTGGNVTPTVGAAAIIANGNFNVDGGVATAGGAQSFVIANAANSVGVVNLNSGTITAAATSGAFGFRVGGGSAAINGSTATANLNGGVLATQQVFVGAGSNINSTFNFNGGVLRATTNNANFFTGLTTQTGSTAVANVRVGGAIVDTQGFSDTITQALSHDPALGGATDGGLLKLGTGMLTLTGANTYNGSTTVNAGGLAVTNLANGGTPSGLGASTSDASNLVLNGGTLRYSGTVAGSTDRGFTLTAAGGAIDSSGAAPLALTGTGAVATSGSGPRALTLTGTNTGNNTFSPSLGDADAPTSLTKAGTGTWTIAGPQAYSGTTTVSAGTLLLSADNVLPGGASLVTTGGTLDLGGHAQTTSGLVSFRGGVVQNGTLTSTGVAFDGQSGTVSATLAGSVGLNKNGAGTLVLAGVNTLSGPVSVNAGALRVQNAGALGSGSVNVNGGAALQLAGDVTLSEPLIVLAGGGIGGAGGALQSVSGNDTVTGGTIRAAVGNTFSLGAAAASMLTVNSNVNGLSDTAHSLTLYGAGNGVINGVVSNLFALTKNDAGTWTLNGANTYTNVTNVNAGTLLVNGSIPAASAVAVNRGAALGGGVGTTAGVVGGRVTLTGGAISAGGNGTSTTPSVGILNVGSLAMGSGSNGGTLVADITGPGTLSGSPTENAGVTYDQVAYVSTAGAGVTGDTVTLQLNDAGYVAASHSGEEFFLIRGGLADNAVSFVNNGVTLADNTAFTDPNGNTYTVQYNAVDPVTGGHDVVLTAGGTSVPEPAALGVLGIGAMGMMARQRRAKRRG